MKQKTDIRARSNIPRFPRTRCALLAKLRCGLTGTAVQPGSTETHTRCQYPRTPPTAPPVNQTITGDDRRHHTIFPTPRRGEAPLPSYGEHGRTFPNQRANAGSCDQTSDIQIILGKVRPLSRPHTEAHPQVLIIAPLAQRRRCDTVRLR